MTMTMTHTTSREANYGWFADALGGIATGVLAVVALAGVHADIIVAIATIVFGAALLIEGGTMLSEYASISFAPGTAGTTSYEFGGGSLSALFMAGVAGIVLGILALLGIHAATLTAISVIAFGSALLFSSAGVWHLHALKHRAMPATEWRSGSEIIVGEMAYGSAGMQAIAGLAALVLGILALILSAAEVLTLTALLVLGAALVLTGSAASDAFVSLMRPHGEMTRTENRTSSFGPAE
jgi:hypothetical protein